MKRLSLIDGGIVVMIVVSLYPLSRATVRADATNLACVIAVGNNCGNAVSNAQCRRLL
jgi:hypothetical protein